MQKINNPTDLHSFDKKGLFAMQRNWIGFAIALCMIFGCTEHPTGNKINEKHGYSLTTYFNGGTSNPKLCIRIDFNGIQHVFPKISIDNQQIDTGYSPANFYHEIVNFRRNGFKAI